MKLLKKIFISGTIKTESGLLIGGSNAELAIGKIDKLVIRDPLTTLPYIPGSSLKGKLRSLYEQATGEISKDKNNNGPCMDPSKASAKLYGYIGKNEKKEQRASRLIVRDSLLSNPDDFKKTELLYTEVKAENSIDRVTSKANPRFFERVPRGAKFAFQMIINVFDGDDEAELIRTLEASIKLLQDDYLGMGGSRGNGQVAIEYEIDKESKSVSSYLSSNKN